MTLNFSSLEFLLLFMPIFLAIYLLTPYSCRNFVLLLGSLVFYALGSPKYLPILMLSVWLNFLLSRQMRGRMRRRRNTRSLLMAGILLNVGFLVFCKYFWRELPLGISFYTFQVLSYLIDLYRGEIRSENSFVRYALYLTMFPQLVSGPIVKFAEVRDSLRSRELCPEGFEEGMKLFTLGLAGKVLLADPLGLLWREVQVTGFESISTVLAWMAAGAFAMKIYFDFAGYSLMAMGLGRVLGFELPRNFKHPYAALSVRDFYRRWHMTLGRWFREYVYIPMGGNRKGFARMAVNLAVVWFITSIWHGESANYLLWGCLLCLLILVESVLERLGASKLLRYVPIRIGAHIWIPAVITVSWVCFAVEDLYQLQIYLGRMLGVLPGIRVSAGDWLRALGRYWYFLLAGGIACTPLVEKFYEKHRNRLWFSTLMVVLFWFCVRRIQVAGNNPFMYSGF